MSQETLGAARGLYDAFNKGDLIAFEKGCAPAFEWNEAESSLYAGAIPTAASRRYWRAFQPTMRDFDNFRCDIERLIDAGDTVVGTGRYRGKHKRTGKNLSAQFCHVLHFDSQLKLDAGQEYADTLQEAEVAGRAVHRADADSQPRCD